MARVTSIKTVYPMDSIMTVGEDGLPVYDRAYNADDVAEVMGAFLTDGVFVNRGDALSVTQEGGTWTVGTGAAVAGGRHIPVVAPAPVIDQGEIGTGQYAYIIVALRRDTEYRDGGIYSIVTTSPSYSPVRDESTCELVLARIDWRGTMTDYRLDNSMCGPVSPFEEIDTDAFMLALRTAVSQFDLNVGTVSSLPSGSTPTITVRKPAAAGGEVYVDFGIPRGASGEPGRSAPGVYVQEGRPTEPGEGCVWMGTNPDTRQIEQLEVYELTPTYPDEAYPDEAYPDGTIRWQPYTIDPALLTGAQTS